MKRACCDFLESQLDPSNCLGIRDFAETHNCLDLMQAAELFSQKHFSEVVQHEEFMLLSQTEVEKLIKCDEIQVSDVLKSRLLPELPNKWTKYVRFLKKMSKTATFFFLVVFRLNTNRERQVPTCSDLSFTQFFRFSGQ